MEGSDMNEEAALKALGGVCVCVCVCVCDQVIRRLVRAEPVVVVVVWRGSRGIAPQKNPTKLLQRRQCLNCLWKFQAECEKHLLPLNPG